MELATWLHERVGELQRLWSDELRARGTVQDTAVDGVVDLFVGQLVSILPFLLGPYRDEMEPLWVRTAELFGRVAAKRGLAAGEVIEEFHILRELVIRDLYRDPPLDGRLPLSLREILRLNRALDRGVTHASVGHTDAMFFQFFEAAGAAGARGDAGIAEEAEAQLGAIRDEFQEVCAHAATAANGGATAR
jgi:hypothetical protein